MHPPVGRGSSKKHRKLIVLGAKMPPKIDPGALRERPGRLLRATSAPNALQSSLRRFLDAPKTGQTQFFGSLGVVSGARDVDLPPFSGSPDARKGVPISNVH